MPRRCLALLVMLATLAMGQSVFAEGTVQLTKKEHTVAVTIDGREFCAYVTDKQYPKPFMYPVKASDGTQVTRGVPIEKGEDHPHHKGIWTAIDEVNEHKFWAEKARIENQKVELKVPSGNPAKLVVVNHWQGVDNKPVLIETTEISIYANRLLAYDIRFSVPEGQTATFHDTKEGLFGIRMANSLREQKGTGQLVNSQGLAGDKAVWGKEAEWVDYSGKIDDKAYGVAIFDNPKNFRKSRWHARGYGLFTVNPFGQKSYTNGALPEQPLTLKAGETLRLRYGLYVHTGDTKDGKVAEVYSDYVKKSAE